MKAVWGEEYDWRKKKMYPCPICPKCHGEVGKIQGKYRCFACGEEVEVDETKHETSRIRCDRQL